MKHLVFKSLCCFAAVTMLVSCGGNSKKAEQEAKAKAEAEQARQDSLKTIETKKVKKASEIALENLPEEPIFDIVTNMGTIKVKLYKKTPKHRDNFAKLALAGYYDGVLFHRVINGFMIQGGDPNTRDTSAAAVATYGQGGPGYNVPAEFVPEYTHKKGALAAARRGDAANPKKESSGSQFYLVQDENACSALNGDYTVFGETVEGLDVIDRIAGVQTDRRDRPVHDVIIKKVILDPASAPKK